MIEAGEIPRVQFTDPGTIRLIPQAYITEPAMASLVDENDELDFLNDLERLTSGRQNELVPLPADFLPEELLTAAHGYGWTYVNAAFCYTRDSGNRFNNKDRGAWYAAYGPHAIETAQAEVGYHLSRELEYTGVFENITDYRELIAGFMAQFHDLGAWAGSSALAQNTDIAYPAGQQLAKNLRSAGSPGILFPSVRHPGGTSLAAFRPNLVQNIRQGNSWRFEWRGDIVPMITKISD